MEAFAGGEARESALCRLVEAHQTELLRMCYLILRDMALAEDAVQVTFLKAYRALPAFRGECSEKSWLSRIAVNTCRDLQRSAWFRHVDRRVTPEMLPEASVPFDAEDETLTLAVMQLPTKLRETLLLYYYQDMTLQEIASTTGVAVSTTSKRLTNAKRRLRETLERGRYHE